MYNFWLDLVQAKKMFGPGRQQLFHHWIVLPELFMDITAWPRVRTCEEPVSLDHTTSTWGLASSDDNMVGENLCNGLFLHHGYIVYNALSTDIFSGSYFDRIIDNKVFQASRFTLPGGKAALDPSIR
jgi:hypothetical protein